MTAVTVSRVPESPAILAPVASGQEEWQPRQTATGALGHTVTFSEATQFFYEHTWLQFADDPEGLGHVLHAMMLAWAEEQLIGSGAYVEWSQEVPGVTLRPGGVWDGEPWTATLLYPVNGPHGVPVVLGRMRGVACDSPVSPQVRLVQAELALKAGIRARRQEGTS